MTKPILDLDLIHDSRRYGDVMALFTWRLDTGKPVLVLVPANIWAGSKVTPCVVPLDSAFMWAPETGDGAHVAEQTHRFAEALGFNAADTGLLLRIHHAVIDSLRDLIHMPPLPRRAQGEVVADAIARDPETGKTIHEGELYDYV